jgi:hypothetical protein
MAVDAPASPAVVARRDDGAAPVALGETALLVSDRGRWVTSTDEALARGEGEGADEPVPDGLLLPGELAQLAERQRMLANRFDPKTRDFLSTWPD